MANLGSVSALTTYVNTNVEDNTSNNVTPADVRQSIINTIDTLVGVGVQPKVYKAILNQTGTDAPVATVLVNTLGGTVVWTRDSMGVYSGTLAGIFLASKTLVFLGGLADPANGYYSYAANEGAPDVVAVKSYSGGFAADAILGDTSIIIEVYP